jgi:hypothetical protein
MNCAAFNVEQHISILKFERMDQVFSPYGTVRAVFRPDFQLLGRNYFERQKKAEIGLSLRIG